MVLVAGGTGVLGGAIVTRLLDEGRPTKVMTRRPDRAAALSARGATIVRADLRDRESLDAACQGATHVISTANAFAGGRGETIAAVDEGGHRNLIEAARAAAVRQFVFTSALVPESYRAIDYFAAKFRTEEYLRSSGVAWTILRPTAFFETWAAVVGEPLVEKGTTTIFGRGETPLNFVAVADVAAIAVMTLDRSDALNAIVEIGGPENLTLMQVADVFERVAAKPGRRKHLPVAVMRAVALLARPFNPVFARMVAAGALGASEPQPFDPAALLAKYPVRLTTLEEWVRNKYHPDPGRGR